MGVLPPYFVKNYLWPTLMALGAAVITALATGAPALILDGIQAKDWPELGSIALSAAFTYLATVLRRYGGRTEPWTDPPVEPRP